MRRSSGDNAVCFKNLEEALAGSPETYGRIDLIAFGFPCQDLSIANTKRKGLEGKKSSIFFECMRIVERLVPDWLLIENVPGLLSSNGGRDFGIVLQTLAECGYGVCWRILDSQYFGVPQRRKRVYIVGCLGRIPEPEILFEQKGCSGDDTQEREVRERGLCVAARDGQRQDPTAETYIASTIQANDYNKGRVLEETHIAEANPIGEGETTGIPRGMDSARGIVIGNAVTVHVAQWIGDRIIKYGYS